MFRNRRFVWPLLVLCFSIAFLAVAYPMYVIRPFRAQGTDELAAALELWRWGPGAAAIAAGVAVACALLIWRTVRSRASRLAAFAMAGLTATVAVFSHVNIFELMFHPVDSPETTAASEAKLDADDMVLAVRVGDDARAYPIRMMGYHHIVNDFVRNVPLVATY